MHCVLYTHATTLPRLACSTWSPACLPACPSPCLPPHPGMQSFRVGVVRNRERQTHRPERERVYLGDRKRVARDSQLDCRAAMQRFRFRLYPVAGGLVVVVVVMGIDSVQCIVMSPINDPHPTIGVQSKASLSIYYINREFVHVNSPRI